MPILDTTTTSPDRQVRFIFADRVVAVGLGNDVTLGSIAAAWHYLTVDSIHQPLGIAVTFPMNSNEAARL